MSAAVQRRRERQNARYKLVMGHARAHLGGLCAECGTHRDLEIDHIDPRSKTAALTELWSTPELFWRELQLCQLLCHDCHAAKTSRERYERVRLAKERARELDALEPSPFDDFQPTESAA